MRFRQLVDPPSTPVGAAGMVLLGALMVQWSATLVGPIFQVIGPAATSAWRFFIGAVVLLALARPRVRAWSRRQWLGAAFLGATSAVMNQSFFQAIHRIPLGTAVAVEFLGPFTVAALGKRDWRHFLYVSVALLGVLALARPGGGANLAGLLFAALAGLGWAGYAFGSHFVGSEGGDFGGLGVAMGFSVVLTFPFLPLSLHALVRHGLEWRMILASLMAVVVGFGAEMQALRRLPPTVVSVLLALDPAVAFAVGYVVLRQRVSPWDYLGLALVIVAGVLVTRDAE